MFYSSSTRIESTYVLLITTNLIPIKMPCLKKILNFLRNYTYENVTFADLQNTVTEEKTTFHIFSTEDKLLADYFGYCQLKKISDLH